MVMGVLRRIPESRELNRERDVSLIFERLRGSGARWGKRIVRATEKKNRRVRTFGARIWISNRRCRYRWHWLGSYSKEMSDKFSNRVK
jgi:hypothetical protein